MNGIEKRELQKARGLNHHVDAMDRLRLRFGFDCVIVLTPKVETRLRSGEHAQIPLRIQVMASASKPSIVFTLSPNYPIENLIVEVLQNEGVRDEVLSTVMQAFCDEQPLPRCIVMAVDFFFSLLGNQIEGDMHGEELPEAEKTEALLEEEVVAGAGGAEGGALMQEGDYGGEAREADVIGTCKRCRSVIFDGGITNHEPDVKDLARRGVRNACTSLFLADTETLNILLPIGQNEGKIVCAKCQTRLGLWNWSGSQCSCGTWVTPAIQITRSKIDEVTKHS